MLAGACTASYFGMAHTQLLLNSSKKLFRVKSRTASVRKGALICNENDLYFSSSRHCWHTANGSSLFTTVSPRSFCILNFPSSRVATTYLFLYLPSVII